MTEYSRATNIDSDDRTAEQDAIVKLVDKTDRLIEKYHEYDDGFIQGKVDRAKARINAGEHTDSSSSDEGDPSDVCRIPEGRGNQIRLLVDTLVYCYGEGDDWRSDETDIRNFMYKNQMTKDEYKNNAKEYFRTQYSSLLDVRTKYSIKNSLRQTYTE